MVWPNIATGENSCGATPEAGSNSEVKKRLAATKPAATAAAAGK